MTLNDIVDLIEQSENPSITADTRIHFIDVDFDGGETELNIYLDDADRLIIRNL